MVAGAIIDITDIMDMVGMVDMIEEGESSAPVLPTTRDPEMVDLRNKAMIIGARRESGGEKVERIDTAALLEVLVLTVWW